MMFSIVMTTCAGKKEADRISDALLERKLAACVKYSGVRSSYWWNGKVARSNESNLTILTTKKNVGKVMLLVKKMHSYKVPEIIEIPIKKGDKRYLEWVADVTE